MKKIFAVLSALLLALVLLAACAPKPVEDEVTGSTPAVDPVTIRIASLKGPTTMGLVKLLDDAEQNFTSYQIESNIYGTPDEITGLLINGDIDAAAIPANLAAVLYGKTDGAIQVAAINTLGVLYVVENGNSVQSISDLAGQTVYSTGKGNTPEYVLRYALSGNGINPDTDLSVEYKSESTEIAALLMADDMPAIAVLPQPYVATVMAQNPRIRIALDLSEVWNEVSGQPVVTGVLVVRREFAEQNPEAMAALLADYRSSTVWVNANPSEAAPLIAALGIVPSAEVAMAALPYCGITFLTGSEMESALGNYLSVLHEYNPQSVGGAMPDAEFYYNAA